MNRLKRWIRVNVLKKETLLFKVYWRYETPNLKKSHVFHIEVHAKSKAEARDKSHEYILKNAKESEYFKFLKVEEK
ncbi:hypothetical protein [Staphylococcus virus vB_SurM-PSU5]|nr:hypothetical protein [Staphylococcus virus vB_SurM-PSU5]